jgi:hypothetical protein
MVRNHSGGRVVQALVRIRLVLAVLLVGVVAACGPSSGEDVTGPPPEPAAPIELWLSATRVPPGDSELVAVLVAHEEVDATFGVAAKVERWDGAAWVARGSISMCLDHWHCTAEVSTGAGAGGPDIGLGASPEYPGSPERFRTAGLEVGWYRLSQEANEGLVATGVFQVVADASEPTPLVATDAPALSVSPILLSPGGQEVAVSPLVPPVNGSLSAADLDAAMADASDTATVERWDGAGWVPILEVGLAIPTGGPVRDRTASLRLLPEGSYRVVVATPDGDLIGSFWVDDIVDG